MRYGLCAGADDLAAVAALGFDFVDLDGAQLVARDDARDVATRLQRLGLPCHGFHASVPPDVGLAGPGFNEKLARAYFRALASCARLVGAAMVCIGSPLSRTLPPDFPAKDADEQMVLSLRAACEEMPDRMVLLESLNRSETNYITSITEAHAMVEQAGLPNLALVLDIYHFQLCGDTLSQLTPDLLQKVRYLHIADPNGRRYPSEAMDASFAKLARTIVRMTGCDHIAIEAPSPAWERDARPGLQYLQTVLGETEE